MSSVAAPVVNDCELRQPDGQLRHDDTLKNAHIRKFVSDLQTHVVAKQCVDQLEFLFLRLRDVKARLPDKARIDVPLAAGMREVEFGVLVVVVCRAPRVFFDVVGAIEFLATLGQDGARVGVLDFIHARCSSARRRSFFSCTVT